MKLHILEKIRVLSESIYKCTFVFCNEYKTWNIFYLKLCIEISNNIFSVV